MKIGRTLRNVFTVGGFTAMSRVLGLVREMLQSRLIGAGVEQSAFTLAFALPNMVRKLFGEGALTAAFVPVFKTAVECEGVEKAARLARAVFALLLVMLLALVMLGWVVLFGVSSFQSPLAYRGDLIVTLVAILLPYMLFICGAAFGMGVLNSLGKFRASSFMPAFLNLVWILALATLFFVPGASLRVRIIFVSSAILLGGAAQLVFMLVCASRAGVNLVRRPALPWSSPQVRLVWKNTAIAALGAGAVQINYMLDQVLGQLAAPWAAGVIGFAERLIDLPLGVVAVAFGTVLLPSFAGHFAKQDVAGARQALKRAILQVTAVMLPAAIVTFFAAPLIVKIIYEGHAFDALATVRVARALSVYGLGLCFFAIQKCLTPYFQAQGDMKTPLRVTVKTVVLNATLNILAVVFLPMEFRHVGLAGSTSFCALVGCILLARPILRARRLA